MPAGDTARGGLHMGVGLRRPLLAGAMSMKARGSQQAKLAAAIRRTQEQSVQLAELQQEKWRLERELAASRKAKRPKEPPSAPERPYDRFSLGPPTSGGREIRGHDGSNWFNVGSVTSERAGLQIQKLFDAQMKRFK